MEIPGDAWPLDGPLRNKRIDENDPRTAIRRYTLILFPIFWGLGFALSRWQGCDTDLALSKATAYAISGFVGYLTYLLIGRPRHPWYAACWTNPSMLGPTITPWPFREMLTFGLASSVCVGLVVGLIFRFVFRNRILASENAGKGPTRSSVHPSSDDQIG